MIQVLYWLLSNHCYGVKTFIEVKLVDGNSCTIRHTLLVKQLYVGTGVAECCPGGLASMYC